ncbi:MAG: hypothetical protein JXL97_17105 [Bacteroidales bacterium]|nr:hypothetical protein [Bacteroidales bacterium]
MKLLLVVFALFLVLNLNSQSVAINTSGSAPDASAMLDVDIANKGLLIPRVSLTSSNDVTTISTPAISLLIYNTNTAGDITPGFYFYNGTKWTPVGEDAYTFENGLTEGGSHAVGLGGTLSSNTVINFSSGFANILYFNLNNSSQFIIQNNGIDNVIFNDNGNVEYKGNLSSGEYYNFEGSFGSGGYGFRTRTGDLEYKNNGDSWTAFPASVSGTPYWWYRPSGEVFIQPQNNDNVRIYDDGETYGFYFDGASNQYGGYFRTTGSYTPTAAVVGFSDVLGNQTKGYLGYDGLWTSASGDFDIDGMAVFGEVKDRGRASIFGVTTRDATYAAIIGYSDVWIAGYYSVLDQDDGTRSHPALYGQMIVDSEKSGEQSAVEGWSEYVGGVGNRGYTTGGDFTAFGWEQDSKGINVNAKSYGTNTVSYGALIDVDSADYIYGVKITAGTLGISSSTCYGVHSTAITSDGTGVVGIGSNASNYYISGYGDGVVGVSDNGYGVFGQFDDGSGNLNQYGILGNDDLDANYFYHNETLTTDGQSAGYFYRTRSLRNDGVSYAYGKTNQAVEGLNGKGDYYSFGVSGHSSFDDYRTGGVLGASFGGTYWGSLGYYASSGNAYGGYFTVTTTGAGKENQNMGVGFGSYGDFMGGWIRGEVYGATVKGDRYSLYVDGQTYTNDIIVNLTDVGEKQRVATYVPTTTSPTIYLSGIGQLSSGKASIQFEEKYQKLISDKQPVIVTVTPIGECNGLHLDYTKSTGFSVGENGKGASEIQFTWIAIATRKGYENVDLPEEIISKDFDKNIDGFMFNEANTKNAAQSLWWNGELQYSVMPEKNDRKIYIDIPKMEIGDKEKQKGNKTKTKQQNTIN